MQVTQIRSRIKELCDFGQSVWLDNISRSLIESGELERLIGLGVSGITSNPSIFDKAISSSPDYDDAIKSLKHKRLGTFQIYDELTIKDIQDTADLFMPIFKDTRGMDGYVSLEVNPLLAHKTDETVQEAQRLHKKVNRPNVLIKIPATGNGFQAAKILLYRGININFTLIFSVEQYLKAVETFIQGANQFFQSKGDLKKLYSVASVFVSRIDMLVDKLLDNRISNEKDASKLKILKSLKGKAAVANSRLIFARYKENSFQKEFKDLESKGFKAQRVLWASTSTKNSDYSDIKYVTELIGKSTINTMPESTIDAFLDHGNIDNTLTQDVGQAREIIDSLNNFGIDINQVCVSLLNDGVVAFENSFSSLFKTIEDKKED